MSTLQDERTAHSRLPLAAWLAPALVIVPTSVAGIVTSVDFVLAAVRSDSGVDAYVIGSLYALLGLVPGLLALWITFGPLRETLSSSDAAEQPSTDRDRLLRRLRPGRSYAVLVVVTLGLALLSIATQPWNSPLWPGRYEASTVPEACAVVDPAALELLVAGAPAGDEDASAVMSSEATACSWRSPVDREPTQQLDVEVTRHKRTPARSATDSAALSMRIHREVRSSIEFDDSAYEPLDGLGDEAWIAATSPAGGNTLVIDVVARLANVWVHTRYDSYFLDPATGGVDSDELRAGVIDLASTAVRQVRLD